MLRSLLKFGQWLGLLAITASLVLLWSLREVVILALAAVVLAMALCTLVGTVRHRLGCPRPLAVLISVLMLTLVIVIIMLLRLRCCGCWR